MAQRTPDGRLVYRLYLVRSYFRTAGRKGMDRDVLEILMGHHTEGTEASYARYTLDDLGAMYRKGEAALYCEREWERDRTDEAAKAAGLHPDLP